MVAPGVMLDRVDAELNLRYFHVLPVENRFVEHDEAGLLHQSAQRTIRTEELRRVELATALTEGGRGRIIEMDESEQVLPGDDGTFALQGANVSAG